MKKIIIFILMTSFLASCDKLVKEKVFSQATTENFFTTSHDVEVAVNGIYNGLQQQGRWQAQSSLADMLPGQMGHYWSPIFQTLKINPTEGFIWNMWQGNYEIIGRANLVLSKLSQSKLSPSEVAKFRAQAKFLRALCYFYLVREFGHIPLVTKLPTDVDNVVLPDSAQQTSLNPKSREYFMQVDRAKVYHFIIEDLKYAEKYLPENYNGTDAGRATSGAASGLLAKVYLTLAGIYYNYETGTLNQGDPVYYDSAVAECEKVISSKKYELVSDYFDIFNPQKKNNKENIFTVRFASSNQLGYDANLGNGIVAYEGIRGASITPYSYKQRYVNDAFYDSWTQANSKNDKRYSSTFLTDFVNTDGDTVKVGDMATFRHPAIRKFLGILHEGKGAKVPQIRAFDYGTDWIVLRYADVLLMYSAALNEAHATPSNKILEGINLVRERAGKSDITLPISQEDLADSIFNERKWELCYEGKYYFDCQRTGRLLQEMATNGNPKRELSASTRLYIMPIPYKARQNNPFLKQNKQW